MGLGDLLEMIESARRTTAPDLESDMRRLVGKQRVRLNWTGEWWELRFPGRRRCFTGKTIAALANSIMASREQLSLGCRLRSIPDPFDAANPQ